MPPRMEIRTAFSPSAACKAGVIFCCGRNICEKSASVAVDEPPEELFRLTML
jgi:hypothetical protein